MSLGIRYDHPDAVTSLAINPIMGHLRWTFALPSLTEGLAVATRYELNAYSFDADVATGVTYGDANADYINCALSWRRGLSFSVTTRIFSQGNSRLRLGVNTGPLKPSPTHATESLPVLSTTHQSASLGFEFIVDY